MRTEPMRGIQTEAPGAPDAPGRPRRPSQTLSVLGWVVALVVVGIIVSIWHWRYTEQEPPSAAAPPTMERPAPRLALEPAARYPIPRLQAETDSTGALPSLDQSDAALFDAFAALFGNRLDKLLYRDGIVRRIVVTVDNLPETKLPRETLAVKPPTGRFLTANDAAEAMRIAPENAYRYVPYVQLAKRISARKLVAVYVHFYPLFEQEYRELGYPSGHFNDRLIDAIDDLLQTPDIDAPAELVQPKVLYEFADPELESLSAGQKIMLRMGADNAVIIKGKLLEIRSLLVASRPGTP